MAETSASGLEGFHYETKFVVLSYLGLLPPGRPPRSYAAAVGGGDKERERHGPIKVQIEEELQKLQEEVSASFPRTGFDLCTSPVFTPTHPESSIEDCLSGLGERVIPDLGSHLDAAVQKLLKGPLDYVCFRDAVQEAASSCLQAGWNKVLVPLVVLQALLREGQPLGTLVLLGVRYLEEAELQFITQQGGWHAVFSLEEEEHGTSLAEDSNDIYILPGEQVAELLSPPASLLSLGDVSGLGSWQTDSLPASLAASESWAQVGGAMDPEDVKSLDSGERSENNSSNSDIVHVEREEAELLESGLQESELVELGAPPETPASEFVALATPSPPVESKLEHPLPGVPVTPAEELSPITPENEEPSEYSVLLCGGAAIVAIIAAVAAYGVLVYRRK